MAGAQHAVDRVACAFVTGLRDHGGRLAVSTADGAISYRELAERVEQTARDLGGSRRLVLVEVANDLPSLIGYLGALAGGHVALVAARSDAAQITTLTALYDPDVVIGGDGTVRERRSGSCHELHPDLALLLTTSGSTGSPRLVQLSTEALDANAAAIAEYLAIGPDDRPVLSLPLNYCYGLSVVNSNLLRGADVLLSEDSVIDPAFWTAFRRHAATSLHGVPYTFELLDHVGFAEMDLPHLRYVTQAGGRLAPDQVRRWAAVGNRQGWELFVMYGQTEATARMAYLPPHLAVQHPDTIGIAVPGGSLRIEALADRSDADGVGELVYSGPNVMLGYAHDPSDLAVGRTVHELHTGDLGRRRSDGLFEVVGRHSRFVKPFGVRTDLDALEHLLAEHGIQAACTGTDARIVIAAQADTHRGQDVEQQVRTVAADRLPFPAGVVVVLALTELPRRPNGKLDYPAVARRADETPMFDLPATSPASSPRWLRRRRVGTVRDVFARTFPGQQLRDDASFVDMGGDSLTYVQVAADIEDALGRLPEGWDHLPLGRLAATPVRRTRRASVETAVLLRALAVVLVVGEHAHLWAVVGGAHLMLALSGWTFARFTLAGPTTPDDPARPDQRGVSRRILHSAARIAVPSSIWITFRALLHNVRFVDALLVGSLLPPLVAGYWFVDTLVQILLVLALLFAAPAVRRLERTHPFAFSATFLLAALVGRFYPTAYGYWFTTDIYSPQVVLWLFVLGWLTYRATTTSQKWMTAAATLVLVPSFFGSDLTRTMIVVAGMFVLQFLPRTTLPRDLARPVTAIASASLGIYLTHFGLLPLESLGVPPVIVVAASLAVGVGTWWAVTAATRLVAEWRARPRTAGARAFLPSSEPSVIGVSPWSTRLATVPIQSPPPYPTPSLRGIRS